MDQREAISIVKKYQLLLKNHFPVEEVYLFGSYAKGTNKPESDIDVAIIVNDLSGDFFSTNPLLWKLRRQIDDRIEPILLDKKNDDSGFLEIIEKEGIRIS
jgi:predicted nucleotidyltransferase